MKTTMHRIEVTGIPEETHRLLVERVRLQGVDSSSYVRHLLDKDLHTPSLSELLNPFREQVRNSGIGEEELDQIFAEARDEVYIERQSALI